MEAFNEAWEVICSYCRKNITDVAYKTWISRIKPVTIDFDRSQSVLLVPNDFHKQTLERCYKTLLTEAFEAVFGTVIDIVFTVVIEEDKDEVEEIVDQGYEYTFDTFIIGNSNKFAHAACMAVAQNPSNAYNPLFLYGNSGLGKTHLLYAIANEIRKNDSTKKVCYVKCEDFTNEMVESIHMNRMDKFREKYRFVDVLLIDDIQFIGGKEATQE